MFSDQSRPKLLMWFAILILVSGALCFVLQRHFVTALSAGAKVPLYTILGMSFTFVFLFVIVDLLNYCDCKCSCCGDEDSARPWVETETQVRI
jgi:hypothetical protein